LALSVEVTGVLRQFGAQKAIKWELNKPISA